MPSVTLTQCTAKLAPSSRQRQDYSDFNRSDRYVPTDIKVNVYSRHRDSYQWVSKPFLEKIRDQVREIVPALRPNVGYTLQQLCGDLFWLSLSKGEPSLAGDCMVHLVCHTSEFPELKITKIPRTRAIEYGLK